MSEVRCDAFERWLDDGDPAPVPAAMQTHARDCARCAAALARARALDALLADTIPATAPGGFTAAVMARLDAAPAPARAPRPVRVPVFADPMPVTARLAMDPAVALSLVLAAVCAWQAPRMLTLARLLAHGMAAAFATVASHATTGSAVWMVTLAFAPLVVLAAWGLYRGSERLGAALTAA